MGFGAVSAGGGIISQGNFLDNITITLRPVIEFSSATYKSQEGQTVVVPQLIVLGTVPVGGTTVSVTLGAATATSGSDFTVGTYTIPAGTYDTPTTLPMTGLIDVVNDAVVENNETVVLTLTPPPANYTIGSTSTCGSAGVASTTYTILDNDVDVLTTKTVSNASPPPGGTTTFTVTYRNNTARPTVGAGADLNVHDVTATSADALPTGFTAFSWTCAASAGATCPAASGTGAISSTPTLAAGTATFGGTLTYTVTGTLSQSQCASTTNTSTIGISGSVFQEATSAQAGFTTPVPGGTANNTASQAVDPGCLTLNKITTGDVGGPFTFAVSNATQAGGSVSTTTANTPTPVDGNSQSGVQPFAISSPGSSIAINETALPASFQINTATCTSGGVVGSLSGSTYTIPGASVTAGRDFDCSFTNARIAQQFSVNKAWGAGSTAGHTASVTTIGGAAQASFTNSTAPTATTGTAVTVNAGDQITLPAEAFGGGAAAGMYVTTVECTGGSPLAAGTAVPAALTIQNNTTATVCTYTNTPVRQQFSVNKAWGAGSTTGHTASVTTIGGVAQASFTNSTAPTATTGTAVTVNAGDQITLPVETFGGGATAGMYATTVGCTGGSLLAAGTAVPATLTIQNNTTATVCTYTNSPITVDLAITKTNTPGVNGNVDQAADTVTGGAQTTYQLHVTNNGPAPAIGARVLDAPVSQLTCPGGTTVTCAPAAACAGPYTVSGLTTSPGIALGTLNTGDSATLSFICSVQ